MSGLRPVPAHTRLSIWWHRRTKPGHHSLLYCGVPGFDLGPRGYFVRCTGCERTWDA